MITEYEKRLGQNLRDIRIRQGLTQEEVSTRLQIRGCDVTRSALAKIEAGQRHLYPQKLKALREIFRVTYEEILEH
ncbi:MAG: helix-turn-helix transcriptional regulator [Oscillospiraceae bacterium]|nr:helix-turn-helix transcriptional regulator [Oscillospiraceae bacterium]